MVAAAQVPFPYTTQGAESGRQNEHSTAFSLPFKRLTESSTNNFHTYFFGQNLVTWSNLVARVAGKCTLSEHFATLNIFNVGLPNKKEKWVLEGQLLSLQVSCNQQEKVYSERILLGVG